MYKNLCIFYRGLDGTYNENETYKPSKAVTREYLWENSLFINYNLKGEQPSIQRGREMYLRGTSHHFISS